MRRAAGGGRSAGVLFLDLTEAFYRIMREITMWHSDRRIDCSCDAQAGLAVFDNA